MRTGRQHLRRPDEVRYIQCWAAAHDGRMVTIGKFLLFSTETGDASLLDPFAAGLARDIEGPAFVYTDCRSRRVSTILGYPINLLGNQHPEISNIFG